VVVAQAARSLAKGVHGIRCCAACREMFASRREAEVARALVAGVRAFAVRCGVFRCEVVAGLAVAELACADPPRLRALPVVIFENMAEIPAPTGVAELAALFEQGFRTR